MGNHFHLAKSFVYLGLFLLSHSSSGCQKAGSPPSGCPDSGTIIDSTCPATNGGNGGNGGMLFTTYAELTGEPLADISDVSGGAGGAGGLATFGTAGKTGSDGVTGEIEVSIHSDIEFDETWINLIDIPLDNARVTIGVPGEEDHIYLMDTADPPLLVLEEFHIGSEGILAIGCDARIVTRTFRIDEGGVLALRNREGQLCPMQIGATDVDEGFGINGGMLFIRADEIVIDGVIDVDGNNGDSSQAGGHGGQIAIVTRLLTLGANASLSAAGGAGGPGSDESDC